MPSRRRRGAVTILIPRATQILTIPGMLLGITRLEPSLMIDSTRLPRTTIASLGLLGAFFGALTLACGDSGTRSASTTQGGTDTADETSEGSSETTAGPGSGPGSGSESDSDGSSSDSTDTSASSDASSDPTTEQPTTDAPTTDAPTTDEPTTDATTDDPSDTDTDTDTDGGDNIVRFIAMGDGGEGNDTQYKVANAVELVCAEKGCDFALYMGDNFYDTGVDAVDDQQFQDKFELPYANLSFPFYVVFGNHDYGMIANNWMKAEYQIDYTQFSDIWTLPSPWYEFTRDHAHFFALDTSRIFWDYQWDEQRDWLISGLANSNATWKFAFGHHPYISNGEHGNAGNYEGLGFPIPIISGTDVKDFMEDAVCGKVDIYFCGHDHNRQWLGPECGTEFVVSGTAAKETGLAHHDPNPTLFEEDADAGFLWVEINGNTLTGVFYDEDGNVEYERVLNK